MKRLVGQATSSRGGTYVVRRRGLLDEIPYVRRIRGVILVRTEDAERVLAFLEDSGAEVHTRTVELTKGDRVVLEGSPRLRPPTERRANERVPVHSSQE